MNSASRIGIGTAQFGFAYGVSNKAGQTSPAEAAAILRRALEAGVRVVDTAAGYGTSEEVLGERLPTGPWRVVTKTPPLKSPSDVREGLRRSLKRLRRPAVDALLVHNADELLGPDGPGVYRELQQAKDAGQVLRVGASVYTAEQIDALLGRYRLDLAQVPLNVLDQRLIVGGGLSRLKDRGVEVHARSAFLQGALLMPTAELPPHLARARAHFERFRLKARDLAMTPLEAALAFVLAVPEVDAVVCGVEGLAHLEEILEAATLSASGADWRGLAVADEAVVNPALWNKAAT